MPRRILNGTVCSASNTKTVVVKVERMLKHPIYKKYIKKYKKYHAHDETNKYKIGDDVKIIESKPFSKKKKWEVINK